MKLCNFYVIIPIVFVTDWIMTQIRYISWLRLFDLLNGFFYFWKIGWNADHLSIWFDFLVKMQVPIVIIKNPVRIDSCPKEFLLFFVFLLFIQSGLFFIKKRLFFLSLLLSLSSVFYCINIWIYFYFCQTFIT